MFGNTLVLNYFTKTWIGAFAHSPKTWLAWMTLTVPSYSATRWWSKLEVVNQVHDIFGDVTMDKLKDELPAYLVAAEDVSPDVETLSWWETH